MARTITSQEEISFSDREFSCSSPQPKTIYSAIAVYRAWQRSKVIVFPPMLLDFCLLPPYSSNLEAIGDD